MTASWAGIAARYDASFARLCAGALGELLDAVGEPAPGARLLDAGTGTGIAARAAHERGWSVDAVDAEPSMVAFAQDAASAVRTRPGSRTQTRPQSRPPSRPPAFAVAGLARLPFGDEDFDAIVANFAVNHVAHPEAAVAELRRVAKPGSRIAATIWPWQPTELNELWAAIMDETGTRPATVALPEGSDFARSEDGLTGLLADAGWGDAAARRLRWEFAIEPAPLWAGVEAGIAVIGQGYEQADAARRAAMTAAFERRAAELAAADGRLRFAVEAILGTGAA